MGLPQVYEVGGCVRDSILGKPAKDIDFMACGVTPEELLSLAQSQGKAEELRVQEQLVGVRLRAPWSGPEGIEIALARTEVSTGPGHLDFEIIPAELPQQLAEAELGDRAGNSLLEQQALLDLSRRDFTCNAIARELASGKLLDPYGGAADLQAGLLRTVSEESFRDDPLRMLRGLARIATDDLTPTPETTRQAKQNAKALHSNPSLPGALSPERIQAELVKIFSGPHSAKALRTAREWGILEGISPPLGEMQGFDQQNRHHSLSLDEHSLQALAEADRRELSPTLKLAVFLHDIGKPATAKPGKKGGMSYYRADPGHPLWKSDPQRAESHERIGSQIARSEMERLSYPSKDCRRVEQLIAGHMFGAEEDFDDKPPQKQALLARRMLSKYGLGLSLELCELRICDRAGKTDQPNPEGFDRHALKLMEVLREQNIHPTARSQLSVDGSRLQQMGLKPGPETGQVLDNLLKIVVGDPQQNRPDLLERHAERQIAALRS